MGGSGNMKRYGVGWDEWALWRQGLPLPVGTTGGSLGSRSFNRMSWAWGSPSLLLWENLEIGLGSGTPTLTTSSLLAFIRDLLDCPIAMEVLRVYMKCSNLPFYQWWQLGAQEMLFPGLANVSHEGERHLLLEPVWNLSHLCVFLANYLGL